MQSRQCDHLECVSTSTTMYLILVGISLDGIMSSHLLPSRSHPWLLHSRQLLTDHIICSRRSNKKTYLLLCYFSTTYPMYFACRNVIAIIHFMLNTICNIFIIITAIPIHSLDSGMILMRREMATMAEPLLQIML